MHKRRLISFYVAAGLVLPSARATAADSNEKEQCISAAEKAQQLRDDGKFQLAREAFGRCAQETCPAVVRKDCGQWLRDVANNSPTVVLKADDELGRELTDVIVMMDDASLAATLDGKPLPVDPGEHLFRFEASNLPAAEQRVIIYATDRNRVLRVQLVATPKPGLAATTLAVNEPPAASEAPAPAVELSRRPPLATWIFTGVAVAALGSEAFFGLTALSDRSADLAPGGCGPHCVASEKRSIQTRFALADASLGIGLVSAGLATYFFLAPRYRSPSVALDFSAYPGGGMTTFRGRF